MINRLEEGCRMREVSLDRNTIQGLHYQVEQFIIRLKRFYLKSGLN